MIYVLTLNWNGLDKLQRLQPGLIKNLENTGRDWKWYVRDNGSTDGSKEWLSEQDNVVLLDVDHNRDNFAQGVNSLADLVKKDAPYVVKGRAVGITRASHPNDFLLLNNDVVFEDDTSLKKMCDLRGHLNIQVVGARLRYNNTNRLQHAGVIFGPRYGNMPYHYRHKENSDVNAEKNRYFQAVTAACCLMNAGEFWAVDGMDEKFSWAFEDIDLCLRINRQGWEKGVAYCGETNIFHEESASLKKNPVNKLFLTRNVNHFKKKWFGKYDLDHEKYLKDPNYNLIK